MIRGRMPASWKWLAVLCICCGSELRLSLAKSETLSSVPTGVTINNDLFSVRYFGETHTVQIWRKTIKVLETEPPQHPPLEVRTTVVSTLLGKGNAIEICDHLGDTQQFIVYPQLPFVFLQTCLANSDKKVRIVDQVVPLDATLFLENYPEQWHVLAHNGLFEADRPQTTYCWLALAKPRVREGIVLGWLTHHRGSGIVETVASQDKLGLRARCEYGTLQVPAGAKVSGEILAVAWFEDVLDGLETYADLAARINDVTLPDKVPCGYCTWYSSPHGGSSDERHLAEFAQFCQDRNLKDYGFDVIQIDDHWQNGLSRKGPRGDYTRHRPDGPYPGGMKAVADRVRYCGFTPGLWFIPFAWNHREPIFQTHQDWFVHHPDGNVYEVYWAGTCLDMSHPQARQFLTASIRRMTRDWGFGYLKIDGLWSGMAAAIRYPAKPYGDDDLGEAVFYDPARTNLQLYRDGLKLVREAAGQEAFLLGCNIAQNLRTLGGSFGLVDGMRVGLDIGARWDKIVKCARAASRQYFWHGRMWFNDPDCLMLREPLTLDQARAWASLIGISGQMNLVSEWLPGLAPQRLDILKRTIPNHGLCGRPIDLLEQTPPKIWQLTDRSMGQRRDIVCIINWDDKSSKTMSIDLKTLGLDSDASYVGFDYWPSRFVAPFSKALQVELPPGSCRIISLQQKLDRPQLVSTSRHVSQGIVDVTEQNWNSPTKVFSGVGRVVKNDPYEIRLYVPADYRVDVVQASDVTRKTEIPVRFEQNDQTVRVNFTPTRTGLVSWLIRFSRR